MGPWIDIGLVVRGGSIEMYLGMGPMDGEVSSSVTMNALVEHRQQTLFTGPKEISIDHVGTIGSRPQ